MQQIIRPLSGRVFGSASVCALLIGLGTAPAALAQITPGGSGTVVNQNGQQFNITGGTQAGRNLFHTFQQFGLTQGQVANFFSNPAIVNILARVNGGSASYINGLIQVLGGNSNLFLMNPAGIVFGPHASLNVPAAFTATTADRIMFPGGSFNAYGNNDYSKLVGEPIGFAFDHKEPAAIVNEGKLAVNPGQSISLIAGQVINTGTIQAPGGKITIAAVPGENWVRLSQAGQLLSLEFNPQQAAQMADAQGNIPVTRLPELLTGGGVTGVTPNSHGTVSVAGSHLPIPVATGTAIISGTLDVSSSSETGGKIGVFGSKVAVVKGQINASGFTGGGEILIGGDFQGKGTVPNAAYTFISSDSQLLADAVNSGNGGRVIVWADKTTQFWGTISAKGGEVAGNGGFVEVSGKESLHFQGKVDTSAPQGNAGTLLLDPENIIVGADSDDDGELTDNQILFSDSPGATFKISTATLSSQLETGNVILQATDNVTFTVNFNYTGTNPTELSIQAGNNISTQAITTNFYEIGLDFQAGNSIQINGAIQTGGGNVNLKATAGTTAVTGKIITKGGNVTLQGAGNVTTSSINTSELYDAGNVTITSNQNITVDSITARSDVASGGKVTLTAATGNVRLTDGDRPYSIDTSGDTGGEIQITHGGNGLVPFIVGNAAVNGSAAGFTTGTSEINPNETFFVSTIIGDISILTGTSPLPPPETAILSEPNQPLFPTQFGDINEILLATPFGVINVDNPTFSSDNPANTVLDILPVVREELLSRLSGDISQVLFLDQLFVNLFAPFLDVQPINSFGTIAEIQNALAGIAEKTGTKPALVYLILDEKQLGIVVIPPGKPQGTADNSGVKIASTQMTNIPITGQPIFRSVPQAKADLLQATVREFLNAIKEPRQRNTNAYRKAGQQLYEWLIAPVEAELKAQGIDTIMFVPDEGLRTLPFGALWDGEQFLVEKFNLGQIPSVNLVNFNYQPLQGVSLLAMGASQFQNQEPLKGVPIELETIAKEWGGKVLMNEQFTVNHLTREREQNGFVLLHLATHAEFRPSTLKDAYIQFWNEQLTLDQVRSLPLRQPPVELLVLSACRTAVGDPYSELGFAGLAVASGVKSALASSWYVSDVGTLALMTEVYQQLQTAPIKAQALREAQLRMIRGQVRLDGQSIVRTGRNPIPSPEPGFQADLSHPYYWAGFTLIGSPW